MRAALDVLRHERRARWFFGTLLQAALGIGAGYVALLLVAYDRYESPWAISLVLLAELLPAMLLGPAFGALADRWSRKRCMVLADSLRAIAFVGVVAVDSFELTVAFAALAGVGTGLFNPAALAALPSVVDEPRRVPAVTSLYGVAGDFGFTGGFALSASLLLVLGGPTGILLVTAATFAVSATVLARLRFGAAPAQPESRDHPTLGREIREGMRATIGMRDVRIVLLASAGGLVCAGVFNVAELPFVTEELGASDAGFSLLVMFFGLGFIAGSLTGSRGGRPPELKRNYLAGLLLLGAGLLATSAAGGVVVVAATFLLAGFGNGLLLVYERLLIQASVPDRLVGRVFGAKDALSAWAFGIAFVAGGALVSELGPRDPIRIAAVTALVVFAGAVVALRREWRDDQPAGELDADADAVLVADAAVDQNGANVVGRRERLGLETLDNSH